MILQDSSFKCGSKIIKQHKERVNSQLHGNKFIV